MVAKLNSAALVLVLLVLSWQSYARAEQPKAPELIGSETCATCHAQAYDAWQNSHHGWAMREPLAENILGDFSGVEFTHKGTTSRFFIRDGKHYINTATEGGAAKDYEIKYAVGVEPLQQYLIELDKGKLQTFDVAWDTQNKRWYSVFPHEDNKPGDGLHWTGPYKNWQAQCAECHQTGFVKGYDTTQRSYDSSWKELTVSCSSCHGGGEAHVKWAQDPAAFDASKYLGIDDKGLTISFAKGNLKDRQKTELNSCARCHSRREPLGADSPVPGTPFNENYVLALLRPGLYHSDGQILDEVYVYGSFLQSKMHEKGVTCSNCHDSHSAELKAEGNAICTQCHSEVGNTEFPTLQTKTYDSSAHHFHEEGTEAAQCVSCHMPDRNYMVVDPRRDHSFRVPRPDLSVDVNVPNACNGCHSDKDAQWATNAVKTWYPDGRSGTPHFSQLFAKAEQGAWDDEVLQGLVDYASGLDNPDIVRATSLSRLSPAINPQIIAKVAPLLKDESALVRTATVPLFRDSPAQVRFQQLMPLLKDPVKSVRVAAVRELLNIAPDRFSQEDRQLVSKVLQEYQASLVAKADLPQVQMAIGGLAMVSRNFQAAEAAFREATALDPQLVQAWNTIARIQMAQSRLPAARKTALQALKKNPDSAQLHQTLGNVSMQFRQPLSAIESFENAVRLEPESALYLVELGNAQLQARQYEAAIKNLSAALQKEPGYPDAIYLLAHSYLASGNVERAR
ncbi:MAG: tetratricopeptide repeat protein, partial [Rhizobiaceae bacterium]